MMFLLTSFQLDPIHEIKFSRKKFNSKTITFSVQPTIAFTHTVDDKFKEELNTEFEPYEPSETEKAAMKKFDVEEIRRNDRMLDTTPMHVILKEKIKKVHLSRDVDIALRNIKAHAYPKRAELLEMLDDSYDPQMKPRWRPSGLKGWRQSPIYRQRRAQCNEAMVELIASGKAIAFSMETLLHERHTELAKTFHLQPLMNVPSRKKAGRTCLNCSANGGPYRWSLNDGSDNVANDAKRPMFTNPSFVEVSDLIIAVHKKYPYERIMAMKIDVRAAYTQYTLRALARYLKPLWFSTVCEQEDDDGTIIKIVVSYLCGVFGYTRGGMAYCTLQEFFDWYHNHDRDRESHTYVDDGMIIQPASRIEESAKRYMEGPFSTLGKQSIEDDRIEQFEHGLEAIGWEWNFQKWTVIPRPTARRKLLWRWWVRLPANENEGCNPRYLDSAVGALTYYAQIVPLVHAFLPSVRYALDRAQKRGELRVYIDDAEAIDDYRWLRAIVWIIACRPELIEKRIDRVGTMDRPNFIIESDASTSIGAGGILTKVNPDGSKDEIEQFVLRWHEEVERKYIRGISDDVERIASEEGEMGEKTSINVLEFYAVMFIVLKHARTLQGAIVYTWCDNTSAVKWINKLKGSNRSKTSRALLRILAVVCQFFDITLKSFHIAGIANIKSDFLSRNTNLQDHVPMPQIAGWIEDEKAVDTWAGKDPARIARTMLGRALSKPSSLHGRVLLRLPIDLLGSCGDKHMKR